MPSASVSGRRIWRDPWWVVVVLAFATTIAVVIAAWSGIGMRLDVPPLRDTARIDAGARLYAQHCASCHGANLEGQPNWRERRPDGRLPAPPHDDSGHTWHHPNDVLFTITKYGLVPPHAPARYASDMPAYARTLNDEDIWAVLAYIQSRWSPRVQRTQEEIDRQSLAR
jgi:mono/diheme cytochrome c family protein